MEARFATLGDDVYHPTNGVAAVQRALRPAQHLDPLDVIGQQSREIELGAIDGISDLDAVYEHQCVPCLGAADAHLGQAAQAAAPAHRQPGNIAQKVGQYRVVLLFDRFLVEHCVGRPSVTCGSRRLTRIYNHRLTLLHFLGTQGRDRRHHADRNKLTDRDCPAYRACFHCHLRPGNYSSNAFRRP